MIKLDLSNKKVLLRVDFNVPLNDNFEITDNTRIMAALPTISHILDQNASVILLSHRGRPQKKLLPDGSLNTELFSLKYLIPELEKNLKTKVLFSDILDREHTSVMASKLQPKEVLLLENTRFDAGEKTGDPQFSKWLSGLGEYYINDAFGTAHRAHATTAIIAEHFPTDKKAMGFLVERELKEAEILLNNDQHPFTAIIGGAKVSDKIQLLKKLILKVDHILIGGGMSYTFIKALGGEIGNSLVEEDKIDLALEILEMAKNNNTQIHLPEDSIVADQFDPQAQSKTSPSDKIGGEWMGLDIGPKAIEHFTDIIAKSKCIFWNGPLGVFEMEKFENGTKSIALAVAQATDNGAYSSIGGGDSVAAVNKFELGQRVSFMSTGGGAMLKLLEGAELPAIKAMV